MAANYSLLSQFSQPIQPAPIAESMAQANQARQRDQSLLLQKQEMGLRNKEFEQMNELRKAQVQKLTQEYTAGQLELASKTLGAVALNPSEEGYRSALETLQSAGVDTSIFPEEFDENGQAFVKNAFIISGMAAQQAKSAAKPYTDIGKMNADVAAGYVTPEQAQNASKTPPKLTRPDAALVTQSDDAVKGANAARATVNELKAALEKTPNILKGPIAGNVAPYLSSNAQTAQTLANTLIGQMRSVLAFPAAGFSDADRSFLENAYNLLKKDPSSAKQILQQMDSLLQKPIDNNNKIRKRFGLETFNEGSENESNNPNVTIEQIKQEVKSRKGVDITDDQANSILNQINSRRPQSSSQGGHIEKIAHAIGKIETGGHKNPYRAVTNAGKGRVALGKYQILNTNLKSWSKEAIGREVTRSEFLTDPELQEQIAKYKMQQYLDQHGSPEDVASMWLSGKPLKGNQRKDIMTGISVPGYVNKFNKFMES